MTLTKKLNTALLQLAILGAFSLQSHAEETSTKADATAIQLQVLSTNIKVYDAPQQSGLVLYEIPKGSLLDVIEQQGNWYKIKVNSQQESGWVQQVPWEYGEMTLSILKSKGDVGYAQEQVGATEPKDAPQTKVFQPAAPNKIVTLPPLDPSQVEPPAANLPRETVPIQDRWRIMQALGFKFPWYDPYNQNHLKGDLPVLKQYGEDLFFNLGVISDTVIEGRRVFTPVSQQSGQQSGANNIFGGLSQMIFSQNIIVSLDITKGNTTFKPPEYEFKFVPVINYNYADIRESGGLNADTSKGNTRSDGFLGVQELFADIHLRNVSSRYDFDSIRVGIQPFISDFRGFLFQDTPVGVRLFGNRDNNRYQYNLAWFRRMEKDTNSGLNDIGHSLRNDDIFVGNLYKQDFPVTGFTSQVSFTYNRNRERAKEYDTNDFLVRPAILGDGRPHTYDVTYLGYTGDGHLGKWNLSTSNYLAIGRDSRNPIAQQRQDIFAGFHASELSRDFDWIRLRGNLLVASGDSNPQDGRATGFDAILENPQFAGASTSYYIRQSIPLIGGGGVAISGRNGLLPSLRSSPIQGQSNFVNPGLLLVGVGADFDITPEFRVFGNVSDLSFMNTSSIAFLRQQAAPSKHMGVDASVGFHWRPYFNQNMIINGSMGAMFLGDGLKDLYGKENNLYSGLINAILTY